MFRYKIKYDIKIEKIIIRNTFIIITENLFEIKHDRFIKMGKIVSIYLKNTFFLIFLKTYGLKNCTF